MQLRNIRIERFKRLEHVNFPVGDVNILIGGNNSGKSTIIQAIHFGFTLFQSLTVSNKWPVKNRQTSTVSPSELIYIPSDDPYSLGFGGRLVEDESKSIVVAFGFDNGEEITVAVRKGRITNILVEPSNIALAQKLSSLGAPYTVYSPGLAGVSRSENYVSDGVVLRALARGDANIVLRNILFRLNQKAEWTKFEEDLSQIFPSNKIKVKFDQTIDQFIDISITDDSGHTIPLDLCGTGLLQAIQLLAYIHLFSPKVIILDEPDSHLHPNNQRLLCSLLASIAMDRSVQVLATTHSRHVIDAMYKDAKLLWVQDGSVLPVSAEDQVEILLELGALDIKEKITSSKYKVIVLTEDRITKYFSILLKNSGFVEAETTILPYNGVTSTHLLRPLVKQIRDLSNAAILVHRDRDYLEPDEIELWNKEIRGIGAEPFVTAEIDIEGYFCTEDYIRNNVSPELSKQVAQVIEAVVQGEEDGIVTSYINSRVDFERKRGTIGSLDIGKLGAAAARKVNKESWQLFKGKKKLAKLRQVLTNRYSEKFDISSSSSLPVDVVLQDISNKYFKKTL